MKKIFPLFLVALVLLGTTGSKKPDEPFHPVAISDFENGNGRIVYADRQQNLVVLQPQKKRGDTRGVWFHALLKGYDPERPLNLVLRSPETKYHLPDPLVYSHDGQTWHRVVGKLDSANIQRSYPIPPKGDSVYVAAGYPYTYSMMRHLCDSLGQDSEVNKGYIALSEDGRPIPYLTIGARPEASRGSIWILGRQHAFESPGSHMMEGFLTWLASEREQAQWLRQRFTFRIVPMVDVDMVYRGGTGKGQAPEDFNRDWQGQSHWNAIRALKREMLKTEQQTPMRLFLDSHSPWPYSTASSHFYCACKQDSLKKAHFLRFRNALGDLEGYDPWVKWSNEQETRPIPNISRRWVDNQGSRQDQTPKFSQLHFATTFEQAFQNRANPQDDYTLPRLREAGRHLGLALYRYWQG